MNDWRSRGGVFIAAMTVFVVLSGGAVGAQNSPPEISVAGSYQVDEGQTLIFDVTATDPDGPIDAIWAEHLPDWGGFVYGGLDAGTFTGNPGYDKYGFYLMLFIASDGELADTAIVSVVVNNANEPPEITVPENTGIDEGQELALEISATDAEGTELTFAVENGFEIAELDDHGDGTAVYTAIPGCQDAGTHDLFFIVTDAGGAADTGVVQITVGNVNASPQFVTEHKVFWVQENEYIYFAFEATDTCDWTIPAITHSPLPDGATYIGGNGSGEFTWTPNYQQKGNYIIEFYASDGELADTLYLIIFVGDANEPPTITVPGPQMVDEMGTQNFDISGFDPESMLLTFSVIDGPEWGDLIDNGDGTATYTVIPGYLDAGVYDVVFTTCDQGDLCDTASVSLTVNNVNAPPTIGGPGWVEGLEGELITYDVYASDVDGTIPSLYIVDTDVPLPGEDIFTDHGDGTGTFAWTPTYDDRALRGVLIVADDGEKLDTVITLVNVLDANQAPVMAMPADTDVDENQPLELEITATDPESEELAFFVDEGPEWGNLTDNGDGTAVYSGLPDYTAAGTYELRVIVCDIGGKCDTGSVFITVNDVNAPPTISGPGNVTGYEGELITYDVSATDIDGTIPSLYIVDTDVPMPVEEIFTDHGDGTGTFAWTPGYDDKALRAVLIVADDGEKLDTVITLVNVLEGNEPPTITMPANTEMDESQVLDLEITGYDPEGAPLTFTIDGGPAWGSIIGTTDNSATYQAAPGCSDNGVYEITFIACDTGSLCDTGSFILTVNFVNDQPYITVEYGTNTINEGETFVAGFTAGDTCDATVTNILPDIMPDGANFMGGTGTAAVMWTPDYTQSGLHAFVIIASDGELTDTAVFFVNVIDVNAPPVIEVPAEASIDEAQLLEFAVTATDVDGTIPALSVFDLPGAAAFMDNGDGTGGFAWTPDTNEAGVYTVGFVASDAEKDDTAYTVITVNDINQPPVLIVPTTQTVGEGSLLEFNVNATDPEGPVQFLAEDLPAWGAFTDNGDGTGTFSGTPGWEDAGEYAAVFIATDGVLNDTGAVAIIVTNVNAPPTIGGPGWVEGYEGELITYDVYASDVDGTIPSLYIIDTDIPVPVEDLFTDNGDGTGTFAWTPNYDDRALRGVLIVADDGEKRDTVITLINVLDANEPPVIHVPAAESVMETETLTFLITATDPQEGTLTFSAENLPSGAMLTQVDDTSAEFTWTPTLNDGDIYTVTFIVADEGLPRSYADTGVTEITVVEYDEPPQLFVPETVTAEETVPFSFQVMAYEPNGQFMLMYPDPETMPEWADYTQGIRSNDTLYGTCFGEAPLDAEGEYVIVFQCSDGYSSVSDSTTLIVTHTNRAPVLDPIGSKTTDEGVNLNFYVSASDLEGDAISFSAENLPAGAFFIDFGTDTARFTWTPDYYSAGVYSVTIIASDGVKADSEVVEITVNNVNGPPVLSLPSNFAVNENELLSYEIQVTDPDDDPVTLVIEDTDIDPGEMLTLTPNADSSVWTFAWQTDYDDAGNYIIVFEASDGLNEGHGMTWITVHEANSPPEIVVVEPAPGGLYRERPQLTIALEDETGLDRAYYRYDACNAGWIIFWQDYGETLEDTLLWTLPEGITDGYHDLYLMVVDDDGTGNPDSCTVKWNFTYDVTEPSVAVLSPETGGTFTSLPELTLALEDNIDLYLLEYQFDGCGGDWNPIWVDFTGTQADTVQWQLPAMANGTHTVFFRVTDDAGNINGDTCTAAWEFTFDNTPPTIQVVSPASGQTFLNEQPVITIEVSDNVGVKRAYYQVDGCDAGWTYFWLGDCGAADTLFDFDTQFFPEGTFTLYFKAVDDAGNINVDSCTYTWIFTLDGEICCCHGIRGNVNCDPDDDINMNDITYLQSYLFFNGPPPLCPEEANVDGSADGVIDMTDLEYLINYIYYQGPSPAFCPLCRKLIKDIIIEK